MAGTVIDSLVIELGLDPRKFTQGQREALNAFKATQEQARKTGGQIEDSSKKAAQSLSLLRGEVLALGAAAIGGAGIVEFGKQLANTGLQLGFTSKIVGTSVEELSLWRNAAKLAGGSAEGMTSFMSRLNGEMNNFQLTGNSAVIPYLRALGINVFDASGKLKGAGEVVHDLVDALDRGAEPGKVAAFLRGIGADPDTINVILQGKQALAGYLEQARKLGGFTKEFADDAKEARNAWDTLGIAVERFGIVSLALAARGIKEFKKLWEGGFAPDANVKAGGFIEEGSPLDSFLSLFGGPKAFRTQKQGSETGGGASFAERFSAAGGGGSTGDVSAGIFVLMQQLKAKGFRITSTTGGEHAGRAHGNGLALDFVPTAGTSIADEARRLRGALAQLGVNATVLDETTQRPDSPKWTGPHGHVQFNTPEASSRYAELAAGGRGGGGSVSSDNRKSEVNIGTINVNGDNAQSVASGLGGAVRGTLSSLPAQVNSGPSK